MNASELAQDIARTTERCLQLHVDYHRNRPPGTPVLCPDCEAEAVVVVRVAFSS